MPRHKKRHTTKLPSQIDKGDFIMLKADTPHGFKLALVVEQPVRPEKGEPWIIKTDVKPRVLSAPSTLRIPVSINEDFDVLA